MVVVVVVFSILLVCVAGVQPCVRSRPARVSSYALGKSCFACGELCMLLDAVQCALTGYVG